MSYLIRRDPFYHRRGLRNTMGRVYQRPFFNPHMSLSRDSRWELAMDVAETENEYIVKASIPGIDPDDLEITFDQNTLSIKGEYKEEEDVQEERYLLRERRYGDFCRSISLPSSVNPDSIEAVYADGVLALNIAKSEDAKPRKIQVQGVENPQVIEGETKDQ